MLIARVDSNSERKIKEICEKIVKEKQGELAKFKGSEGLKVTLKSITSFILETFLLP